MPCVTITDPQSGSEAEIAVHRGFNCYAFRARVGQRTVDVFDCQPDFPSTAEKPSRSGAPLLFPFPNRIADARFAWEGREYRLTPRPGMPHAIHGFALDRPWRVTHRTPESVTAEFQISRDAPERLSQWPADGRIEATYRVHGATLRLDIRITNPDTRPFPFGFGTHTYFKLPLAAGSDPRRCVIQTDAARHWVLNESIPTGAIQPVPARADLRGGARFGDLQLDDVLTELAPAGEHHETVIMDEAAGLEVVQQFDRQYREITAFTPPWTTAVCLEPYTCTTDAVNLAARGIDSGWRVLAPGDLFQSWIQISARPILV